MLKLFVNTWGNYNENGADGGEWITLPMDAEELEAKLEAIAAAMQDDDPEWAIHDYEWEGEMDFGDVGEMDSITGWNEKLQDADSLDKYDLMEVAAAIEAYGYSLEEAIERQQRGCFIFYCDMTMEDVAQEIVSECYFTKDTPEILERYFDYEAFARDLSFDGYTETEYGVICDN